MDDRILSEADGFKSGDTVHGRNLFTVFSAAKLDFIPSLVTICCVASLGQTTEGVGIVWTMKGLLVGAASVAITSMVIGSAYMQKEQFYPTVVYLTKSNPSMAVSSPSKRVS